MKNWDIPNTTIETKKQITAGMVISARQCIQTMEIAIPRDRNGEYESCLIKKYQNTVTQDMEEKILSIDFLRNQQTSSQKD